MNPHASRLGLAALCAALALPTARAGSLLDAYDKALERSPDMRGQQFRTLAARQRVVTERRGYLPTLSANGSYLWVDQDISQEEIEVLRQGQADFEAQNVEATLEQPLFDPTVGPRVRAARAALESREALDEVGVATLTQTVVERYILAARQREILGSLERVQTRLEAEAVAVRQNLDAKVASKWDAEVVQRNLANVRRDQNILNHELRRDLLFLGLSEKDALAVPAELAPKKDMDLTDLVPGESPSLRGVQAEVTELDQRIQHVNRRGWPKLSLLGRYELDDADNSVFGGEREITNYEVGVVARWELFSGGRNHSEARELSYLKQARLAEAEAHENLAREELRNAQLALDHLYRQEEQARQALHHQREIQDAATRGHQAGTHTYLDALDAFLLSESAYRDLQAIRYETLLTHVRGYAAVHGWNRDLVGKIDAILAAP